MAAPEPAADDGYEIVRSAATPIVGLREGAALQGPGA